MPLTKPECLECDYDLRGVRFGDMCPECGCVERKLRFYGGSRVMRWYILILAGLLGLSVCSMAVSWAQIHVFPQVQADWLRQSMGVVRMVLLPLLVLLAAAGVLVSYARVMYAAMQHELNRAKLVQLGLCVGGAAVALVCAMVWAAV